MNTSVPAYGRGIERLIPVFPEAESISSNQKTPSFRKGVFYGSFWFCFPLERSCWLNGFVTGLLQATAPKSRRSGRISRSFFPLQFRVCVFLDRFRHFEDVVDIDVCSKQI